MSHVTHMNESCHTYVLGCRIGSKALLAKALISSIHSAFSHHYQSIVPLNVPYIVPSTKAMGMPTYPTYYIVHSTKALVSSIDHILKPNPQTPEPNP